jgi:non-specific serine/threonine protein kinase
LLDQEGPAEREAGLRLAGALGYAWLFLGRSVEGWRWLEEALRRAPEADPGVRMQALMRAGALLCSLGKLSQARDKLNEALALAEQRHESAAIAEVLTHLGVCAEADTDAAESGRLFDAALHCWSELGDPFWTGYISLNRGWAALARGKNTEAVPFLSDALNQLQQSGSIHLTGFAHYLLALAECELGNLPRAVAPARECLRVSAVYQDRWLLAHAAQAILVLIGERADLVQCARLLGAADALTEVTSPTIGSQGAWIHAPASHAVQRLATLHARVEQELLDSAYREGRLLSFVTAASLAEQLLVDIAHELAPRDSVTDASVEPLHSGAMEGSLSAREQEVLRLVAQGLTNKEIARQLTISPSTVNYHLNSLFHKLAVDTRAQAVAVAAQRGLL